MFNRNVFSGSFDFTYMYVSNRQIVDEYNMHNIKNS